MAVVIPAPEIPPRINKGGSQHQLDAMKADNKAPKVATLFARSGGDSLAAEISGVEVSGVELSGAEASGTDASEGFPALAHGELD